MEILLLQFHVCYEVIFVIYIAEIAEVCLVYFWCTKSQTPRLITTPIAQLVRPRTSNPKVAASIPVLEVTSLVTEIALKLRVKINGRLLTKFSRLLPVSTGFSTQDGG